MDVENAEDIVNLVAQDGKEQDLVQFQGGQGLVAGPKQPLPQC